MIIKLEHERKKRAEIEKARKKTVRRYLWDIGASLPCSPWHKRVILTDLKCLINSHPYMLHSRTQLEEEIGTPETIVQTYIGDDAVPILRRSLRQRRLSYSVAGILLLLLALILTLILVSPSGRYTEQIFWDTQDPLETTTIGAPGMEELVPARRGSKTITYYDRLNTKVWSITVTGLFGYSYGNVSEAVESACEGTLYEDDAALVRKESFLAGDAVRAEGTVEYDGLTLLKDVTLTCDQYGKLS